MSTMFLSYIFLLPLVIHQPESLLNNWAFVWSSHLHYRGIYGCLLRSRGFHFSPVGAPLGVQHASDLL
ncbi:hypothetical protein GIB67_014689 [Kingdonia uniflora]|uniref:Secreted protein n=1 Tax=Kingdonia uniflora TaxID=39325 RepID=A0A7J7L4U7_9MAGN|nr:hypothetical protein GIB67_014689 [Kingdonia uniflora]